MKNEELLLPIITILTCTILLSGGFIYSTHDVELDQEWVKSGATRTQLYVMFTIFSFFVFTMIWGFVFMAGSGMDEKENKKGGRMKEDKEKFECAKCGCYFWTKDRNNFKCPNCEVEE